MLKNSQQFEVFVGNVFDGNVSKIVVSDDEGDLDTDPIFVSDKESTEDTDSGSWPNQEIPNWLAGLNTPKMILGHAEKTCCT
ncbi:hypothetical protein J6590_010395 [Homalodisca vitripennis]|nr:hypothetical protein J6590_010395 [Homalodisca vitripennis]